MHALNIAKRMSVPTSLPVDGSASPFECTLALMQNGSERNPVAGKCSRENLGHRDECGILEGGAD